jgi:hypothetical protein
MKREDARETLENAKSIKEAFVGGGFALRTRAEPSAFAL